VPPLLLEALALSLAGATEAYNRGDAIVPTQFFGRVGTTNAHVAGGRAARREQTNRSFMAKAAMGLFCAAK